MSNTITADPTDELQNEFAEEKQNKPKGKAKAKPQAKAKDDEGPQDDVGNESAGIQPCVGLPVQFHTERGPVPGLLARKSLTTEGWDVKIMPAGALSWVLRPSVNQCSVDEARPGHWSFLPGFGG